MNTTSLLYRSSVVWLLIALLFPMAACAHTGASSAGSLLDGLGHPFGGLDHLCAVIGVGLWAAQRGGRAIWMVPLAFVLVMAIGGLLGMAGLLVPFVESGIVASVLILGVLTAAAIRMPLAASMGIVGLFALFHGHAHGTELPGMASGLPYALGCIAGTAILHGSGVALGLISSRSNWAWLPRYAGVGIALCGIYLCLPH